MLQFKDASISFLQPGLYRIDSETEVLQAYSGEAIVKQREKQTRVDPTRLYFFELSTDTKKFSDGTDDEFFDWAQNRNQVIAEENQAAQADDQDDADLGSAPLLNFNVPYGGVGTANGFPPLGNSYPYSGFFVNTYAPSMFWALPPLPSPALIIRRPLPYRGVSPTWPRSGAWRSRHTSTTSTWLTSHPLGIYPHSSYLRSVTPSRPLINLSRPTYNRPMPTPHVAAPAGHVGRR